MYSEILTGNTCICICHIEVDWLDFLISDQIKQVIQSVLFKWTKQLGQAEQQQQKQVIQPQYSMQYSFYILSSLSPLKV